uniref:Coat protein n=1 Tax=Sodiomyces alkalinus partitivirus 2 TaxID=2050969 RepID=A0A2D1WBJ2_9VIRU|nr:coat protein [Sodiomyces alkalinus partitivirus 2]
MSSTVAPSDSASAATGRKSKPGKAERAARRAATGSVAGEQTSQAKAMVFSSAVAAPKPQPGKFPVVFQTGAGEPSRDITFSPEPKVLATSLSSFLPAFKENAKYAEFLSYSEYDDGDFDRQLRSAALLRLAQQLVHSHVNLGLPQGDFSPIASTEIRVPASVSAFVSQYGEHAVPALGTRFLLRDYNSTVKSIVWAAKNVLGKDDDDGVIRRAWLPMSQSDGHTKALIAAALNDLLLGVEINYRTVDVEAAVMSGNPPSSWEDIKNVLGDTDQRKDRFDFLFRAFANAPTFVTAFTTVEASAVLAELNLSWETPSAGHVDWGFNAKEAFTDLADSWAQKSATCAQFFEMSSSMVNRNAATGSQSQMAHVKTADSITIIKTHLALSAPEFSLVACFPATGVYSGGLVRNVVLTTPLSVKQRTTEFIQMDWR